MVHTKKEEKKIKGKQEAEVEPHFQGSSYCVMHVIMFDLFCCVCCALPCRLVNLEKLKSKKIKSTKELS